jgi:hypothetical protein
MTKFHFIGMIFLAFAGLMSSLGLWNLLSFFLLRRRGTVERRPARVQIARGQQGSRQVRLVVELEDPFGETVDLYARTTNKDWISLDGEPVVVVYDPQQPLRGWIALDLRNRLKLVAVVTPLFLVIGGGLVLIGVMS